MSYHFLVRRLAMGASGGSIALSTFPQGPETYTSNTHDQIIQIDVSMHLAITQMQDVISRRVAPRRVASRRVASRRVASRRVASRRVASESTGYHPALPCLASPRLTSPRLILLYGQSPY